jgi:putative ABC transport system permease protein
VIPDATIGIYLAVVAAVVVLTLGSSVGAARRAIRLPAVEAVAA